MRRDAREHEGFIAVCETADRLGHALGVRTSTFAGAKTCSLGIGFRTQRGLTRAPSRAQTGVQARGRASA